MSELTTFEDLKEGTIFRPLHDDHTFQKESDTHGRHVYLYEGTGSKLFNKSDAVYIVIG
ncbi:hypothetical protein PJWF_00091 [Achromobacter phage JWF]|uniref:hypothetical protein n=1 Tax=Achromobacter phage JWF TaxID=1589748 RepID=UPI000588E761|nr:hypothetical protein AXJ13_gp097 [Achromobacter phage JWF]AJD82984.1 hypothetical protein PJWF_00091 [Achromobacter phage JWF]